MNRMYRLSLLAAFTLATAAPGQSLDDEWKSVPNEDATLTPPPLVSTPLRGMPLRARSPQPSAELLSRLSHEEKRNEVSMVAAPTLGRGNRGQAVWLGFPLWGLRLLFGITDSFDVGVGFDSYYFLMNEPRVAMRALLLKGKVWSLSASFEGGYAFFAKRASRENFGARHWSGRRNINISPALVVAQQGSHWRAARLFAELRYTLTLDTEPQPSAPLVGVPPAVMPGHVVTLKLGSELPLSSRTALVVALWVDVRAHSENSLFMPGGFAGLVTSL